MSGRISAATERALERVRAGTHTAYAAARIEGVALSTIYRALRREPEKIMHVQATINGREISVDLRRGNPAQVQRALRAATKAAGADWRGAEIFVADFPERGRYLQKSAGYESLGSGG